MSHEFQYIGLAIHKDYMIHAYCVPTSSVNINQVQTFLNSLNALVMKQTPRSLTKRLMDSFPDISQIDVKDSQNNTILSTCLHN